MAESQENCVSSKDASGFMGGEIEEPRVMVEFYVGEEGVGEVLLMALRRPSGMRVVGSHEHPICRHE